MGRRENPDVMVVLDGTTRTRSYKTCVHPYEKAEPHGYLAWHNWAEKHMKTHVHTPCPDCGLYVVCKRIVKSSAG